MEKVRWRNFLFLGLFICNSCSSSQEMEPAPEVRVLTGGDYKGTWNSSTAIRTFSNYPISAKITEVSAGKFEGSFFVTNSFVSCCGGTNDGTIRFTSTGDAIADFTWDDTIVGCNGVFNGSGTITAKDKFRVDFTGNDCDGSHTGYLTLSK